MEYIFHGDAGIGKSYLARSLFPGEPVYSKNPNKYFDGYQNETIIIWDDLDLIHPSMFTYYFKIWTDRYGVRGEIKGSSIPLNHKYFIFTSQYSFEEMFTDLKTREGWEEDVSFMRWHIIKILILNSICYS